MTGDFYGLSDLGWRGCFIQRSCWVDLVYHQGATGQKCRKLGRRAERRDPQVDSMEHGGIIPINDWPYNRDFGNFSTINSDC